MGCIVQLINLVGDFCTYRGAYFSGICPAKIEDTVWKYHTNGFICRIWLGIATQFSSFYQSFLLHLCILTFFSSDYCHTVDLFEGEEARTFNYRTLGNGSGFNHRNDHISLGYLNYFQS